MDELYEIEGYKLLKETLLDYGKMRDGSCATPSQIGYMMQVIKKHRFKNGDGIRRVVEVGVCTGLTSLFMLKAGKDNDDFCLYGIEKGEGDFYGHSVYENTTEDERKKWKFFTGCTTYDVERILGGGEKIDVAFIDGMHAHPGPLIDFLMLYPYMREDALVLFHDVETYLEPSELGGCYFYTGWNGKKRLNYCATNPKGESRETEYMGILDIGRKSQEIFSDLIEIARQPITGCSFSYCDKEDPLGIEKEDLDVTLRKYMESHYPGDFVDEIIDILLGNFYEYKRRWIYYKHQNRLMDLRRFNDVDNTKIFSTIQKKVLETSKIAIWGAGYKGKMFMKSILEGNNDMMIAAWVDSERQNGLVKKPEVLKEVDFTYLIIAVNEEKIYNEIKNQAIKLGVDKNKIKWICDM